jgi:hypothetical protein
MVGRPAAAAAAAAGGGGLILGDRQAQGHAGICFNYCYRIAYSSARYILRRLSAYFVLTLFFSQNVLSTF